MKSRATDSGIARDSGSWATEASLLRPFPSDHDMVSMSTQKERRFDKDPIPAHRSRLTQQVASPRYTRTCRLQRLRVRPGLDRSEASIVELKEVQAHEHEA